jgi:hypothetical protein
MVGMGIPLSAIPDIRALFDRANDINPIDFSTALPVCPSQLFFC